MVTEAIAGFLRSESISRPAFSIRYAAPFEVLHLDRDARGDAQSGNRRRDEGVAFGPRNRDVKFSGEPLGDLHGREPAVGVVDEFDEDDAARRRGDAGHHVESRGERRRGDLGKRADHGVGVGHRLSGHLQRRGFGRRDHHHHVALILLGEESRGQFAPHDEDHPEDHGHEHARAGDVAHQRRREGRVTVHLPCEPAVEGGEKSLLRRLPASQQQGAERRGERQGVEGRDDHRNGDRHRKLLEQPPRDAAGERHGDEYGQQHDCRGDDRRGHVAHGLQRRLAGFHAPFDIDLRGLDDDDGVVDHKADGQHQSQQRDDVDGKSQQREQREGADERHGDRHQGDDRRAPVLEEEEDDEDDEDDEDILGTDSSPKISKEDRRKAYILVNHNQQMHVYNQIASKLGLQKHFGEVALKPSRFINRFSEKTASNRAIADKPRGKADVVLVDEAHLLLTQGDQGYSGKNMLHDLLRRAKVVIAVFDPNQILQTSQRWSEEDQDMLFPQQAESDVQKLLLAIAGSWSDLCH